MLKVGQCRKPKTAGQARSCSTYLQILCENFAARLEASLSRSYGLLEAFRQETSDAGTMRRRSFRYTSTVLVIIPFRVAAVSKRSPLQLLLHLPEYPAAALVRMCNNGARRDGLASGSRLISPLPGRPFATYDG